MKYCFGVDIGGTTVKMGLFAENGDIRDKWEIIIHKVKDLLVAVALGMEPNTKWTGLEDANGGYIVVKDDGEVLCYHIYDRNKLRNYLFRNTKFDKIGRASCRERG